MRNLSLTIALLLFTLLANAQKQKQQLSESIHDDEKIMHVSIKGDASNGKKVNYHRNFNVAGMTKADKDALIQRIADSLGVKHRGLQTPPTPPPAPAPPLPMAGHKGDSHFDSEVHDDGNIMHVKISGIKGKGTFSYSKNFNVKGLTKADKDALIKHITDSLGVSEKVRHN